mgnify:CR=1 FL=1
MLPQELKNIILLFGQEGSTNQIFNSFLTQCKLAEGYMFITRDCDIVPMCDKSHERLAKISKYKHLKSFLYCRYFDGITNLQHEFYPDCFGLLTDFMAINHTLRKVFV